MIEPCPSYMLYHFLISATIKKIRSYKGEALMKKKISILLCISLFLFSGCSNKIPSLNVVSENGSEWAQEELQGYKLDDFVNAWGTSEDNWKTAEAEDVVSENGYLWFVDNDKTTAIIVYVSNEEEFQSIAISKDVIKDNYGTFIVK